MQIVKVPFPKSEYHGGYDDTDLNTYDLEKIEGRDIGTLIYYYGTEPYAGSGNALYRIGNQWGWTSLSHCSCYGPFGDDYFAATTQGSLQDLMAKCSEGWMKEMQPLFDKAIELGF
jgi:hypothetical protein